jgi:2-methylcitrate dehydratase
MTIRATGSPARVGTVERLADWAVTIHSSEIEPAAIQQAKLLLLDTIGCGLAATEQHAAHAVLEATAGIGGIPQCSVIGSATKTSMPNAVLANGMLIRVLDLNDYVIEPDGSIGGHPSDNIPVALAAGELGGRSGRDVLAAIVIGYELFGRCKGFLERRSLWDGSSISGIVAPVMAGWLMQLNREALSHAIALSVANAAMSAVVRTGDMSAAKSLANALVAQNGVQAALLARHGVTGPLAVLDHPRGMKAVFPKLDTAAMTLPLQAGSYVMRSNVKAYPCVATAQAAVAAALELHCLIGGDAALIDRIRVVMADIPTVRTHQDDRERADPKSHEAADHSFPFLIAVALLDGEFGLSQFDNERWNDADVRAIMNRIEMTTDAELAKRAPGSYPCLLEAIGKDGRSYRAEVLFPPGFSRDGLQRAAIVAKFHGLTTDRLSQMVRDNIVDAVMALDDNPSLAPLLATLSEAAPP